MTLSSAAMVVSLLAWTALGHLVVVVVCVVALGFDGPRILGVHAALKPLKFAVSIALFLGTMAVLLPSLSLGPAARGWVAGVLASTMVVEMFVIVTQALRGKRSHFNLETGFDAALWHLMLLTIVIATLVMLGVAILATARPIAAPPLLALAWRAGLWLFLAAAVSGFSMGGRLRHSVGGDDGGPGRVLANFSTTHGDLRVSHFFALHALQLLPLLAWLVLRLPLPERARTVVVVGAIVAAVGLCVGTYVQALLGRAFP